MFHHPILHPGNIYLSDIAVSNAHTLFGASTPTLPALMDLVHIIQAAILHEKLLVSPFAELDNSLVQQLEGVAKWSFEEKGTEEEDDADAVSADELFSTVLNSMALRFEDRMKMKLVPGLLSAVTTLKMMDLDTVGGLVAKVLKSVQRTVYLSPFEP